MLYAYSYSKETNGSDPEKYIIMGFTPVTNGVKKFDKWSVVFIQTIRNFCDKTSGVTEDDVISHVTAQELGHQWDIDPDNKGCTKYCAMSNSLDPANLRVCYYCDNHFKAFQHSPSCIPSYICNYSTGEQLVQFEDEDRPFEDIAQDEIIISNELSLNVASDQDQHYLGEPIRLLVTLKNISEKPMHVWDSLELFIEAIRIIAYYPNGKTMRYTWPISLFFGLVDKENYKGYVLEPGESLREFYYPLLSFHGYLFPKAGVYSIRATYEADLPGNKYLWQGTIASESKNISIREPEGDDLEALALFEKLGDVRAVGDGYALRHTRGDIE